MIFQVSYRSLTVSTPSVSSESETPAVPCFSPFFAIRRRRLFWSRLASVSSSPLVSSPVSPLDQPAMTSHFPACLRCQRAMKRHSHRKCSFSSPDGRVLFSFLILLATTRGRFWASLVCQSSKTCWTKAWTSGERAARVSCSCSSFGLPPLALAFCSLCRCLTSKRTPFRYSCDTTCPTQSRQGAKHFKS